MSKLKGALRLLGMVVTMVIVTSCGSSSHRSSASRAARRSASARIGRARAGAWNGLGARLADWKTAHPKDSGPAGSGCSGEGCYGSQLTNDGASTYQFTSFSTTGPPAYRVDGYAQALGNGTSLQSAKADVLALLPSGTTTLSFRIDHDQNGSCALWTVEDKTLGRWFSAKKIGDPKGDIGIVLDRLPASGNAVFDAHDVSDASVGVGAIASSVGC